MSLRQCFSQALPSIVKDTMVSSRFVQIKHVSVKYVAFVTTVTYLPSIDHRHNGSFADRLFSSRLADCAVKG